MAVQCRLICLSKSILLDKANHKTRNSAFASERVGGGVNMIDLSGYEFEKSVFWVVYGR